MATILVAYASKHGSTREVAEAVADELRERFAVDVRPARKVRSVAAYTGVVLGASIYRGKVNKDALHFLERHVGTGVDIAVFALGPRTLAEEEVRQTRAQLEHGLATVPGFAPVAIAVFGGVIDPAKLHFPFNRMPASDARDWHAIRLWAARVGAFFGKTAPPGEVSPHRTSAPARMAVVR